MTIGNSSANCPKPTVLTQHHRLADEELGYIINYDIKYRMGKEDRS